MRRARRFAADVLARKAAVITPVVLVFQPYEKQAKADKQRYEKEKEEYEASGGAPAKKATKKKGKKAKKDDDEVLASRLSAPLDSYQRRCLCRQRARNRVRMSPLRRRPLVATTTSKRLCSSFRLNLFLSVSRSMVAL